MKTKEKRQLEQVIDVSLIDDDRSANDIGRNEKWDLELNTSSNNSYQTPSHTDHHENQSATKDQVHDSGDDFSAECDEIHEVETSDEPQDVFHGGLEHVQADGRLNGKFLETTEILEKLAGCITMKDKIPNGRKENVYFIVNFDDNVNRRQNGQKSAFRDDCGVWKSVGSVTSRTPYTIRSDGSLYKIWLRDGQYCKEQLIKKERKYIPLEHQPSTDNLIVIRRNYTIMKSDPSYKRRITWIEQCPEKMNIAPEYAIVEYIGHYPGLSVHGNNKNNIEYVRSSYKVMKQIAEDVQHNQPRKVYNHLILENSITEAPRNLKQVRNVKHKNARQKRNNTNVNNFADHVQNLANMALTENTFVRQVTFGDGKVPTAILYTDEQIEDIKRFCFKMDGTGEVLGVDKTYNLSNVFVTTTVYKNMSVVKNETGEAPLFLGPMLLHGNSDFELFTTFFSHIAAKLKDKQFSQLTIGSDEEGGIGKAIRFCFGEAKHVLCSRHLKNNTIKHLADKIGLPSAERKKIIDALFGDNGIALAENSIMFDHKVEEVKKLCPTEFSRHLTNKLIPILKDNTIMKDNKLWTNNNSESINNILKLETEWKSQNLTDLVSSLEKIVRAQFKEIMRAIPGIGNFKIEPLFKKYRTDYHAWVEMSQEDRRMLYMKFTKAKGRNPKSVTSTDGKLTVPTKPSSGKKPGQRKRKINAKTFSLPRTKKAKL